MPENENYTPEWMGAIVALASHPYTKDFQDIIFSGDPQLVSPLMVVVEVVKENRNHYDENSGMETSKSGTFQCKCLWYSQKSFQFEETWLSSRLLTVIAPNNRSENLLTHLKEFGSKVIFKTAQLEAKKIKSSISDSGGTKGKKMTSLLPFVAPVMQVVGTGKSDSKEPFIDPKTGMRKRWVSKMLVKCKYFNPSDKLSEVLIPVEALNLVAPVNEGLLSDINSAKEGNKLLVVAFAHDKDSWTLIQPKNVSSANGNYFFEGWDYLKNKIREIDVSTVLKVRAVNGNFPKLPSFEVTDATIIRYAVTTANIQSMLSKVNCEFLKIRYKDFELNETTRTIRDWQFRNLANEDGVVEEYVQAFCLLRHDERTFKVSNIQSVEFLLPQELSKPPALNGQGIANQN